MELSGYLHFLLILWGGDVSSTPTIAVEYTFDFFPSVTTEWFAIGDATAPPDSSAFIDEMLKRSTMEVSLTPTGQLPINATFNISDLDKAIAPYKTLCRM